MLDSVLLQKYLFQYKNLVLEGMGTIRIKPVGALLDFPNRQLHAPAVELVFSTQEQSAAHLYHWLAKELQCSPFDAREQVHQLTNRFQADLSKHQQAMWPFLGSFERNADGSIGFSSLWKPVSAVPVEAERVIRSGASHTIRVGEEMRTNAEMEQLIQTRNRSTRAYWWVAALVLFFVSVAAIIVFVSDHKMHWLRQSNYHPIEVKDAPLQYKKP